MTTKTKDPPATLADALRAAARECRDPALRRWSSRLADGDAALADERRQAERPGAEPAPNTPG